MPDNSKNLSNVLDYWKYIELFTPQDFKPPKKNETTELSELNISETPWERLKDKVRKDKDGKEKIWRWYHTVYLGIFKQQRLLDLLDKKFEDKDNFSEQKIDYNKKASVSFRVSPDGILDHKSITISSCAWAIGKLNNNDWELGKLDYKELEKLQEDIKCVECFEKGNSDETLSKETLSKETLSKETLSKETLKTLIDCIKEKVGSFDILECRDNHQVVSTLYKNEPVNSQDFLNSFYVEDLESVKKYITSIGSGLSSFLGDPLNPSLSFNLNNNLI